MVERGYYSAPLPVTALKTLFRKVGIEPTFFPFRGNVLPLDNLLLSILL